MWFKGLADFWMVLGKRKQDQCQEAISLLEALHRV
jgi:hypothetical protein